MPTPMPTIEAMVGAVVLTLVKAAMIAINDEPMPSPTIATASGNPAATTEPNAMTRMISATMIPTASAVPLGAEKFSAT